MAWNLNSDRPIYIQIVEKLTMQIASGYYQPTDRMPSVRDLALDAGVNPNTMQKALAELERSGLVITQRTSGRIVTEDIEMIQKVQSDLATEQIQIFIKRMRELGYAAADIVALVEKEAQLDL